MDLFFLSADHTPLTKTFDRDGKGQLIKHSYPHAQRFHSHKESVRYLSDFERHLKAHAKKSHCLLKGTLTEDLDKQSRAGKTDRNAPTEWVCLDIDGIPGVEDPETLLKEIPECSTANYIVQYSASSGIVPGKGLAAHLFMLLQEPMEPAELKQWLWHLNLTTPMLREACALNRLGSTIRWPLDVSTCQNDKLLYIAPPILKGGLRDPLGSRRISLIKKRTNTIAPNMDFDRRGSERDRLSLLNALRKEQGLPPRRKETKVFKGFEVSAKPDVVEITETREDRGFVYLNLNGGDSWGYYHPVASPDIIHNFKGEPLLSARDISPSYHKEATRLATARKQEMRLEEQSKAVTEGQGNLILAFRNMNDDQYYIGSYDARENRADVRPTSNLTKLNHFLEEQNEFPLDVVPSWEYAFRFDDEVIRPADKFLNKYSPTGYMDLPRSTNTTVPLNIRRVLQHVLNDTDKVYTAYLNWLAYIYQYRDKPQTAWLLHGTEGTGKNLLFSRVLAPIFGPRYCITVPLSALEDQFNQQFETAVLILISEADLESTRNPKAVMEHLRELVTDTPISIRPMRGARYDAASYCAVMLSSNQPASLRISHGDRRFNVATRQDRELLVDDAFLEALDAELPFFAQHLASIKVDRKAVRRPIDTEARRHLQLIADSSIDDIARSITLGDLDFFTSLLPEPGSLLTDGSTMILADQYRRIVVEAAKACIERKEHRVTRDQLYTLFAYCIDKVPSSPHKFTKFLRYHGLYTTRLRKDGISIWGKTVMWKASREILDYLRHDVIKAVKA